MILRLLAAMPLLRCGGIFLSGLLLVVDALAVQADAGPVPAVQQITVKEASAQQVLTQQVSIKQLPKIAIVIDDLGNNPAADQRALRLSGQITASILPLCPHSVAEAKAAKAKGWLVIAHVPMQSDDSNALGPGGLTELMSQAEFRKQLAQDLDSVPGISGTSNHMGSRLTSNRQFMQWLMEELKARPALFFLDSRTTAATVAATTARQIGVPILERDVFFDHERNREAIDKQFDRMLRIARRKGSAIAIGHPYPETMSVLEARIPQLAQQGYRLVRLDELLPAAIASLTIIPPTIAPSAISK